MNNVRIKCCLSGRVWPFCRDYNTCVFTCNKMICVVIFSGGVLMCNVLHINGVYLYCYLILLYNIKSNGWYMHIIRGCATLAYPGPDRTQWQNWVLGYSAAQSQGERKVPLSASLWAIVLKQQMIYYISYRKGQPKNDLYLSHSLRP